MTTPITDKKEMYRRLNSGLLGHTLPAAETKEKAGALVLKYSHGKFAMRIKEAGGKTQFNLTAPEVMDQAYLLREGSWNMSPMLRDEHRVCYCHLLDGPGGWALHYTNSPKPARLKLSDGCVQKNLSGLAARMYLRGCMDVKGWDTLTELVDEYPDHVIEFSVMTSSLEAFGPTNTIFWEVRYTTGQYERGSEWDSYLKRLEGD